MNLRGIEGLAFLTAVTAVTSGCMDMELTPVEETGADPVAAKTSAMTWCPGQSFKATGSFVNFAGEADLDGGVPDAGESDDPMPDAKLCGWQNGRTGTS